eukprot:CAMPEP_0185496970 /NCGR_PEP_ID=MMETSP1366-20130426/18642_1 /TAXON_ID=38817 /ORGANISM="Gephyrocapsa oceanica, Strain RCC1303" /LENGTH=123 /DNA_ID=CAMNT_0028106061 /DNA_START=176 /DNA_END=544 /DNA_ORIENTATION=-
MAVARYQELAARAKIRQVPVNEEHVVLGVRFAGQGHGRPGLLLAAQPRADDLLQGFVANYADDERDPEGRLRHSGLAALVGRLAAHVADTELGVENAHRRRVAGDICVGAMGHQRAVWQKVPV